MDLYDTGKKGNGPKTALLKVMDLYDIERKGNGPVVHFALKKIKLLRQPQWLTRKLALSIFLYFNRRERKTSF
jgi:hypothetical protein